MFCVAFSVLITCQTLNFVHHLFVHHNNNSFLLMVGVVWGRGILHVLCCFKMLEFSVKHYRWIHCGKNKNSFIATVPMTGCYIIGSLRADSETGLILYPHWDSQPETHVEKLPSFRSSQLRSKLRACWTLTPEPMQNE